MMTKVQPWIDGLLSGVSDHCVHWPFARQKNGYGKMRHNKKDYMAHRFVCELAHGKPKPQQLALHSCGNPSCVNPAHLRWGSAKENTQDAIEAGTFPTGSRANKSSLTDRDVRRIRSLRASGQTYQSIADDFGVTIASAYRIANRQSWAHIQ